jgi:hypothetical protein
MRDVNLGFEYGPANIEILVAYALNNILDLRILVAYTVDARFKATIVPPCSRECLKSGNTIFGKTALELGRNTWACFISFSTPLSALCNGLGRIIENDDDVKSIFDVSLSYFGVD